MMNTEQLIALRNRLITAYANRHSFGAAEAYVEALEAEVELTNFNGRRGSVKHLLALVDAALEARRKLKSPVASPAHKAVAKKTRPKRGSLGKAKQPNLSE